MIENIVDGLVDTGWVVLPGFMPLEWVCRLRGKAEIQWEAGEFHAAGIGRGDDQNVDDMIRGDQIRWLESSDAGVLAEYLAFMEDLRLGLNRMLFLGLFEFEVQFAVYQPGTFYRRHLDNFRGTSARIVTAILYLNEDWQEADGGQLRIYTDGTAGGPYVDVLPEAGTLLVFLSERFWHEVRPANRERFSLTGWLRAREEGVL